MGAAMRYQPQGRARLNSSNPLTRGLTAARTPADSLATRVGAPRVSTLGPSGLNYVATSPANYWQASPSSLVSIFPTWTILAFVDGAIAGGTSNGQPVFTERPNAMQIVKVDIGRSASGVVGLTVRDAGGALLFVDGTSNLSTMVGPRVVVATRRSSNDHRIFVNGRQEGSGATNVAGSFAETPAIIGVDLQDTSVVYSGGASLIACWNRALSDAEIAQISANPWQLFDAGSSGSAYQAAIASASASSGGGVVTNTPVSPALASLVLTGYAPTVVRGASVAIGPAPGGLSIVGYAPAVTQGTTTSVVPGVGALSIAGYAPSITQSINASIAPGSAGLALTGYAPTVARTANQSQTPQPGALTITGYAPTVVRSFNQSIVVPASAGSVTMLALTGYAPSISQGLNVVPQYYDATIMQLSAVRGTANLGPDRIQQTVDLV